MDSIPEFPIPTPSEEKAIREYLSVEEAFMADQTYTDSPSKTRIREYCIRVIVSTYSQHGDSNAFIPYLAMNYLDRFISRNPLPKILGSVEDNIRLFALCCFTIAWKVRDSDFSLPQFLTNTFPDLNPAKVLEMEFAIINGLHWRMRPVTAFTFLNCYYPKYEALGGFKRRCIHELIVQSIDISMTKYKPSTIAKASFLAAAEVLYGRKTRTSNGQLNSCWSLMIDTCINNEIQIQPASRIIGCSAASETEESQRTQTRNVPETESQSEIVPAEDDITKTLWNFDLKWIKPDAQPEDQLLQGIFPEKPLEIEGTRTVHSSFMSRLRAGCSNCNIM